MFFLTCWTTLIINTPIGNILGKYFSNHIQDLQAIRGWESLVHKIIKTVYSYKKKNNNDDGKNPINFFLTFNQVSSISVHACNALKSTLYFC